MACSKLHDTNRGTQDCANSPTIGCTRLAVDLSSRFITALIAWSLCVSGSALIAQERPLITAIQTDCLLMVLDQVEVAARRDGILTKRAARTGEDVSADDLLFQLSDEESQARLQVAMSELQQATVSAENQWNIQVAEIELQKSTKEIELLEQVGRTPFLERYRAFNAKQKNEAELRLAEALHRENVYAKHVAEAEVDVARLDLDNREIVSPVSGTIVKQYRHVGEWCRQGEPVVKVLRMDELMVQAIVNIRDLPPHDVVGRKAAATFQLGDEPAMQIDGLTITRCSPEVDLDGNYLVWTVIENQKRPSFAGQPQWLLRPGISGLLTIERSPR